MRSLIGRLLAPGEEIPQAPAPAGYLAPDPPAADPAAQPSAAPCAPPEELAEEAESSGPSASRPRPLVLCIDDDPSILRAIATRLATYGVEVAQACSGMEGYWLGLKRRPDVIITDLHMPDGEGNYVLARFRSHPITKDVPVILLTANDNPGTKRQLLSLGASAYLVKPLDFEDMLGHLREYIPLAEKPLTVR
jgi:CheY-like chemotaxis protein